MSITIRQETEPDFDRVHHIIAEAFANEPHSDGSEPNLVARLRRSEAFIPELSLVAEFDGKLVGHILLTRVKIKNKSQSYDSLALAPVSVLPKFQRTGIGEALIRAAHKKAKELGYGSIVLIGHEDYYPRFGYQPAHTFGITFPFEAPPENCMVAELKPDSLGSVSGEVVYPEVFFG